MQLEAPTMSMNFNPNLTVSAMDPRKLISSCERDSVGEGFPADEQLWSRYILESWDIPSQFIVCWKNENTNTYIIYEISIEK